MKLWGFLLLPVLLGCSGGDDDFSTVACSAGKTQACACTDGDVGAQACNAKGTAWGKCECAADGEGGGSAAQAECATDEDCPLTARPYCVAFACAPPVVAGPGEPCPHGTECTAGFVCDAGSCLVGGKR